MDTAQTVARALGILEILSKHPLTASQIIDQTDMHRSTAYRLLSTLGQLGYIRKEEKSSLYSLSPKILTLASSVKETKDIKEVARPYIDELHRQTGETIHLAVLDNDEIVYLDKRESNRSLRVVMSSRTGAHAPLYCTGIGKAILAGLEAEELHRYLKKIEFKPYTANTITNIQQLLTELEMIQSQGFAEDREEHENGVYCIAKSITDAAGKTIAAFSVSMPSVRKNEDIRFALIQTVKEISEKISAALV